jgi:hypothetical protein
MKRSVNRVDVLCETHGEMMIEFSRLCLGHLKKHPAFRLFLGVFRHFLDSNVLKEIDKDRLIIRHAAAEFEKGRHRTSIDINKLFNETKEIDNDFMKELSNPFLTIEIKYEEFGEIRKKRISAIVGLVFDLLHGWRDKKTFQANVKSSFTEKTYRAVLLEILHLYNVETRILSNSTTFHGPARKVKDLVTDKLFDVMEQTALEIASDFAGRVYADW